MGREVLCRVEYDGKVGEAKALLETDSLIVRSPFKVSVPFRDIRRIESGDGVLTVEWEEHTIRLFLDAEADKWAGKIRQPKSVVEKLGVKPHQKATVLGSLDAFADELQRVGVDVSRRLRKGSDVIFYEAADRDALSRMSSLKESIKPAGTIWVIRPKGKDGLPENVVMAAGKEAGLVDVKVVKFSETHTAEKFVIPIAKRKG